ncbi:hypothetical protein BH10PSE9_BH10PSE9_14510 [soil metagenome]
MVVKRSFTMTQYLPSPKVRVADTEAGDFQKEFDQA